MIVGNWMQNKPLTIASDTLVSEAKRLLSENNLHALPVVDGGRLRGLVTRANLLRMGHFVLRTQSPDEFKFFVNRLKVRDVMVRNPATVNVDDTMEHCLRKGRELAVAQFPVMDRDQVVGVISANEVFQLAAHCIGALERNNGVTLARLRLGPGVLGRIVDVVEASGATLQAIYLVGHPNEGDVDEKKIVILHLQTAEMGGVVAALEEAGFPVVEANESRRTSVPALVS